MDDRTEEFGAIMLELTALEGTEDDPKSAKRLRALARRIEAFSQTDENLDVKPLRRAWSEKYIAAFPMPEWAPNKWLPLDHDNVSALARRHKMPTDVMAIARLREALSAALSCWSQQLSADQQPTSGEVERQVADTAAVTGALARMVEALPESVHMDLDERLRIYLPETAVWNFLEVLKECLPKAAESYLDGKRWTERLGYVPQAGPGNRGTGEAFRGLIEALVGVWKNHSPDQKKNRAWASKRNSGLLNFNDGGRFVRDAAALLTRGDAPELTPVVLRDVVKPKNPHRKMAKFENLVRSTADRKKDS